MSKMIITFSGLCGVGKTDVIRSVAKLIPAMSVSLGDAIRNEIRSRGWEASPSVERQVQIELREKYGQAAAAIALKHSIIGALGSCDLLLIDSVCSPSELDQISGLGERTYAFSIHAHRHLRLERLANRNSRSMSAEDMMLRDNLELSELGKGVTLGRAEYQFTNNTDLPSITRAVSEQIAALKLV
ncbi:AAA family ATPase [Novosphingobium sp.]|uniref:AAA family ATPase n=1 Tax=Novosphingobium sp. TaxID=1874826 RepID=UPI0025E59845|nr:AAA family ATPase [Novosphingobium sp.]MCC6925709.1 AAA family ATPase [Novosphingobium sp.]